METAKFAVPTEGKDELLEQTARVTESYANEPTIAEMLQNPEQREKLVTTAIAFALQPVMKYIEEIVGKPVFDPSDVPDHCAEITFLNHTTMQIGRVSLGIVDSKHDFSIEWFHSLEHGKEQVIGALMMLSNCARLCTRLVTARFKDLLTDIPNDLLMEQNSTMLIRGYETVDKRIGFIITIGRITAEELGKINEETEDLDTALGEITGEAQAEVEADAAEAQEDNAAGVGSDMLTAEPQGDAPAEPAKAEPQAEK